MAIHDSPEFSAFRSTLGDLLSVDNETRTKAEVSLTPFLNVKN